MIRAVRINNVIASILFLSLAESSWTYAGNCSMFNLAQSGAPGTVEVELCLNAMGPISCQKFTLQSLSLGITTRTSGPNGAGYVNAGIRILTPGYTFLNINQTCTRIYNNFCIFTANSAPVKNITIQSNNLMIAAGSYNSTPGNTFFPFLAQSTNNGLNWVYPISSNTNTLPPDFIPYPLPAPLSSPIVPFPFISTSCNQLNCIVAGSYWTGLVNGFNPVLFPLLANSTDGGTTWSYRIDDNLATLPTGYVRSGLFTSTFCDANSCFAAGSYMRTTFYSPVNAVSVPLLARSINGGVNWSYVTSTEIAAPPGPYPYNYANNGIFNTVTCSGSVCVVAGRYDAFIGLPGKNFFTYPFLANSTDAGATWQYRIDGTAAVPGGPGFATLPPDYVNSGNFNTTSCNGFNCIVGGTYSINYNGLQTFYPLLMSSSDGGNTWTNRITSNPAMLPLDYNNNGNFVSSSCNGTTCIAAGSYSDATKSYPMLAYSLNGGVTWTYSIDKNPATLPVDYNNNGKFNSISCSGMNCVAVGSYSNALKSFPLVAQSSNGGITWAYKIFSNPATLPFDYNDSGFFNVVNCNKQSCIAGGQYTNSTTTFPLLAYSNDGGLTWAYGIYSLPANLPVDYVNRGVFYGASTGISSFFLPESLRRVTNDDQNISEEETMELIRGLKEARQ